MTANAQKKIDSLAMLLGDEDIFQDAFKSTNVEKKTQQKKAKPMDHIDSLLNASKKFKVKDLTFEYVEGDPVLFCREPSQMRKQRQDCLSCAKKFEKNKDMNYCDFCGTANCADCVKKTRYFYSDVKDEDKEGKGGFWASLEAKKHRGKICNLCSRKFYINNLLCSSFKLIDAQDKALQSTKT